VIDNKKYMIYSGMSVSKQNPCVQGTVVRHSGSDPGNYDQSRRGLRLGLTNVVVDQYCLRARGGIGRLGLSGYFYRVNTYCENTKA
jgi:hypothetical protein